MRAAAVAAVIRRFGSYRWVGLYDVGREQISLLGWDGPGPPAHPRFPRGVVTQDLKKKLYDALKPKAPAEDAKADVAPKA